LPDAEAHVVVVEDERGIALPLTGRLEREGFRVTHAADGASGLTKAGGPDVDLVILDLMLPGLSGTDLLARLRESGNDVPVICLTAKAGETDRVGHLVAGADDSVTKPFSVDELVARVRAVLRRSSRTDEAPEGVVELDEVRIDLDGHSVERAGERHDLSALEAGILRCLLRRRGRATTRAQILDEVWGRYAAVTDRTIDFHVKNLRRKLEERPDAPELLVTVHGIGYRLG
jgi:two-component system response regulator RegX3